jgi:nucleoside-diphosphate-sugar epimerase
MAKRAFVLGGTGQIGRAAARRLAEAGWDVTVGARERVELEYARSVAVDRKAGLALDGAYDALVDCICMTREHAEQLLALDGVGTVVAISSASVYTDDEGRSLDEAEGEDTFPRFEGPIRETQRTVEPGDATYSTQKRAMELALLEQERVPATVVRPCAIHGPHSKSHIREWFFVKRADDARRVVPLAYGGASLFHTTSVPNLAELVLLACERPATRVVNCGDPGPPTVLEIGRAVAAALGREWTDVLIPGASEIGSNPWGVPRPLVVDMSAAERELGYAPVTTYAEAVLDTVRWLLDERPPMAEYLHRFFDYEAEDAFLRELGGG